MSESVQPVAGTLLATAAPGIYPGAGSATGLRYWNGADLTDANLRRANLRGAELRGTILCRTLMPDGSINNSWCR